MELNRANVYYRSEFCSSHAFVDNAHLKVSLIFLTPSLDWESS